MRQWARGRTVTEVKKSSQVVPCNFSTGLIEYLKNSKKTKAISMSSTTEARVAVITGGSSGIGLHAARALRSRGLNVYELSRRAENAEPGVTHLQADVTDEAQVDAAVAEVLRRGAHRHSHQQRGLRHLGCDRVHADAGGPAAVRCELFRHGEHEPRSPARHAAAGRRPHREHELRCRADRHSVSGVLLGLQGCRAHVFARARE